LAAQNFNAGNGFSAALIFIFEVFENSFCAKQPELIIKNAFFRREKKTQHTPLRRPAQTDIWAPASWKLLD